MSVCRCVRAWQEVERRFYDYHRMPYSYEITASLQPRLRYLPTPAETCLAQTDLMMERMASSLSVAAPISSSEVKKSWSYNCTTSGERDPAGLRI